MPQSTPHSSSDPTRPATTVPGLAAPARLPAPARSSGLDYDNRLRLHGAGAPLVYVPGIDGTGELFYAQLPRLAHRFRIATYRLRDEAVSMDQLVDDLAAVIGTVSPMGEPATLVAESFGGALAMSAALRHPERVGRLVVLNSFARLDAPWRLHVAIGGMQLLPWQVTSGIRRLSSLRHHSPTTPRADVVRSLRVTSTSTRVGYLNRLRILSRYDLRERLPEIAAPTLYLAGDRDTLIPSVRQARFMASRVPRATLRLLEGHGHAPFLAPDVNVDQLLREWEATR